MSDFIADSDRAESGGKNDASIMCRGATIHRKFGASRFRSTIRFHDTLADISIRIAIYFCFVHTNSAQALDWSLRLRNVHNALKEIGTIKRFYSVYGVYYVLLHFIQSSVITKCGFIPEKRS